MIVPQKCLQSFVMSYCLKVGYGFHLPPCLQWYTGTGTPKGTYVYFLKVGRKHAMLCVIVGKCTSSPASFLSFPFLCMLALEQLLWSPRLPGHLHEDFFGILPAIPLTRPHTCALTSWTRDKSRWQTLSYVSSVSLSPILSAWVFEKLPTASLYSAKLIFWFLHTPFSNPGSVPFPLTLPFYVFQHKKPDSGIWFFPPLCSHRHKCRHIRVLTTR